MMRITIREEWKEIKDFPGYKISNYGKVYSSKTNKCLKTYKRRNSPNKQYYVRVVLSNRGIRRTHLVHRLLSQSFICNPLNKPQVNHIDGNGLNNKLENLEWATAQENIIHGFKNGLIKAISMPGERNGASKLKDIDVIKIRMLKGKVSQRKLGKMFSVSQRTIGRVLNNLSWNHLL